MAPIKRAVSTVPVISFLRLEDYSQGGGLPDGDYLWSNLQFVMFQPTKKDGTVVGPARLSVQIVMEPPAGATTTEEQRVQNYSMGSNAHLTYQPDPTSGGKKLALVPGGPASPLYESTNWHYLLKSIYDTTTVPEDLPMDDLSVFEGIVAHMTSIPEPEERRNFRTSLAELDPNAGKRVNRIAVVAEIKSAPWIEGVPAKAPTPELATPAPPAKASLPSRKTGVLPASPAPAAPTQAVNGGDVDILGKIASVLESNPNGVGKTALRMAVFKDVRGLANGQALMDQYFSSDETLNALLNQWGYKLAGANVTLI